MADVDTLLAVVEAVFVPYTQVLLLSRTHRQSTELFRIVLNFHPANYPSLAAQFGLATSVDRAASYYLGFAYFKQGDLVNAEKWLKDAQEANPRDSRIPYQLGFVYRKQGREADRQADERGPTHSRVHLLLNELLRLAVHLADRGDQLGGGRGQPCIIRAAQHQRYAGFAIPKCRV